MSEDIATLHDQVSRLLTVLETQSKRIHNLECALMCMHSYEVDGENVSYLGTKSPTEKMMEEFFEASGSLGAFVADEFLSVE